MDGLEYGEDYEEYLFLFSRWADSLAEIMLEHEDQAKNILIRSVMLMPPKILDRMYAQRHRSVLDKNIIFLTINPSSEVEFDDFKTKVDKLVSSTSFIKNAVYTFEQRGTTAREVGKGFHCHILFDYIKGNNPSKIQSNVFQKFNKMCGNKMHIDVRKYPASMREDKIAYMKGDKWDADKSSAVKINKLFREKYSLLEIYAQ